MCKRPYEFKFEIDGKPCTAEEAGADMDAKDIAEAEAKAMLYVTPLERGMSASGMLTDIALLGSRTTRRISCGRC